MPSRPERSLPRVARRAVVLIAIGTLVGCASSPPLAPRAASGVDAGPHAASGVDTEPALGAAAVAAPTLYDELGGARGVDELIEQFIREIAADERIRGRYRDSDIARFHRMMQEQMCERTGGGCVYTGDDMRRTHAGMDIHPGEFNAIVEALMTAMDKRRLPAATQNRLLEIYAPMRADIIDR